LTQVNTGPPRASYNKEMKVTVYEYSKCSTCRKALKFLDARGVSYEKKPIVEAPPSRAELARMLALVGELKRLFNTSGELYRELKVSEKLKTMTPDQALDLLAKHGKLIKRPFVLGDDVGLVGFDEKRWAELF
jgi:arsenate reductase (glutaredoxin)